jgi:hypothetical protein
MGHVCSRFFAHLPAEASVRPPKIQPKSFIKMILPVTHTRSIACAQAVAHSSEACDMGCELRNREIGDGSGPQLTQRSARPEQVEQSEFLSNTIPPEGDAEWVLYFAMPKLTDRAPISHTGKKSYLVTVTVAVGEETFQFVFPPE